MTGKDDQRPGGWHVPPWELPGHFRLDAEPHSGPLVRGLANAGWVCAVASYACLGGFLLPLCCVRVPFLALSATGLGAALLGGGVGPTAWLLAGRQLGGMRAGRVSREGEWAGH